MPEAGDERTTSLEASSARFQEVFDAVGRAVRKSFPRAEPAFAYRMAGWRVPLPARAVRPPEGTLDPSALLILLVERKAGITLHFWNPVDYRGLEEARPDLQKAGFKVMRGCIQFNRKQSFPVEAVARFFESVRRTVDAK